MSRPFLANRESVTCQVEYRTTSTVLRLKSAFSEEKVICARAKLMVQCTEYTTCRGGDIASAWHKVGRSRHG